MIKKVAFFFNVPVLIKVESLMQVPSGNKNTYLRENAWREMLIVHI